MNWGQAFMVGIGANILLTIAKAFISDLAEVIQLRNERIRHERNRPVLPVARVL